MDVMFTAQTPELNTTRRQLPFVSTFFHNAEAEAEAEMNQNDRKKLVTVSECVAMLDQYGISMCEKTLRKHMRGQLRVAVRRVGGRYYLRTAAIFQIFALE